MQPPLNVEHNASFLIDNKRLTHKRDIKCDDMGVWYCKGSPLIYLHASTNKDGKLTDAKRLEGKPVSSSEQYLVLKRSYHLNASSPDCHKILSNLQGNNEQYFAV